MMWFIKWIRDALISLDIIHANARILILGLENAGKYTLLRWMTDRTLGILEPGQHLTSQELIFNGTRYTTFNVGGDQQAQCLLEDGSPEVDIKGVIFVIDATDRERFAKAKTELGVLLSLEKLLTTPFLVLGNKVDHRDAISEAQLPKGQGLEDGFRWLAQYR
ncbi:ARF/SAR superfamily [Camillea tinctor]|nr:ARF/SAR superfamily [Camillea tinctor]